MDPRALWLSATFAAAKLAIALWCGQLALSVLDRRRVTLAWQIALSAATISVSWWAMRTGGVPSWWQPTWIVSSLLAAAALLDCVRRWLSGPPPNVQADLSPEGASVALRKVSNDATGGATGATPPDSQLVHNLLAVIGLGVTAVSTAAALLAQLPAETLPRVAAVVQMLTCAGLLGIVLAASFELTIGATGQTLLGLNWHRLGRLALACLIVQLGVSTIIITLLRGGSTPVESLTPIFFALGMIVVAYIVWTIPRQMVVLGAKGQMEGQASLAIAGWLAAICLAVACALPAAWPWSQVSTPDSVGSTSMFGLGSTGYAQVVPRSSR